MSNPKKKTPLQEAIVFWTERYKEAKQAGANKTMEAADLFLQYLHAMLPQEKEFARIMWNGGVDYSLEQTDSSVRKYKEPDFHTFFKQYEP